MDNNDSLKDKIINTIFHAKKGEVYFYNYMTDEIIVENKNRYKKFIKKYEVTDGSDLTRKEWDYVYILESQNIFQIPEYKDYRLIRNNFIKENNLPFSSKISQKEFLNYLANNKNLENQWEDYYKYSKYLDVVNWICEKNLAFYETVDEMYQSILNFAMDIYKNKTWKKFHSSDIIHGTYGSRDFYYCLMGNSYSSQGLMIYEGEEGLNALQTMLSSGDDNVDKTLILTHQNNYCIYYQNAKDVTDEELDFFDSFDIENDVPDMVCKIFRYGKCFSAINRLNIQEAKTMYVALLSLCKFFKTYESMRKMHNSNKKKFVHFTYNYLISDKVDICLDEKDLLAKPSKPLWSPRGFMTCKPTVKSLNKEYEFRVAGMPLMPDPNENGLMRTLFMCMIADHKKGEILNTYFTGSKRYLNPMEDVADYYSSYFNKNGVAKVMIVDNQSDYALLRTILPNKIEVRIDKFLPEIDNEIESVVDDSIVNHSA